MISVTSDGQYFSFSLTASCYVYKYQGNTYVLYDQKILSDTDSTETKVAINGEFLAVGNGIFGKTTIFTNTGSTFSALSNNSTLLGGSAVSSFALSSNSKYFVISWLYESYLYDNLLQDNLREAQFFRPQVNSPKFKPKKKNKTLMLQENDVLLLTLHL